MTTINIKSTILNELIKQAISNMNKDLQLSKNIVDLLFLTTIGRSFFSIRYKLIEKQSFDVDKEYSNWKEFLLNYLDLSEDININSIDMSIRDYKYIMKWYEDSWTLTRHVYDDWFKTVAQKQFFSYKYTNYEELYNKCKVD